MKDLSNLIGQFPFARHLQLLNTIVNGSGLFSVVSNFVRSDPSNNTTVTRLDLEIRDASHNLILALEFYIGDFDCESSDFCSEDILNIRSEQPNEGAEILVNLFEPSWEPPLINRKWVISILAKILTDGAIPSVFLSWLFKGFNYHRKAGFYHYSSPTNYRGRQIRVIDQDRKSVMSKNCDTKFVSLSGFQMHFAQGQSNAYMNLESCSGFIDDDGDMWICKGSSSGMGIGVSIQQTKMEFRFPTFEYLKHCCEERLLTLNYWAHLFLPEDQQINEIVFNSPMNHHREIKVSCDGRSIEWGKILALAID